MEKLTLNKKYKTQGLLSKMFKSNNQEYMERLAVLLKLGYLSFNQVDNQFHYEPINHLLFNIHKEGLFFENTVEELIDYVWAELTTADGKEAFDKQED